VEALLFFYFSLKISRKAFPTSSPLCPPLGKDFGGGGGKKIHILPHLFSRNARGGGKKKEVARKKKLSSFLMKKKEGLKRRGRKKGRAVELEKDR